MLEGEDGRFHIECADFGATRQYFVSWWWLYGRDYYGGDDGERERVRIIVAGYHSEADGWVVMLMWVKALFVPHIPWLLRRCRAHDQATTP